MPRSIRTLFRRSDLGAAAGYTVVVVVAVGLMIWHWHDGSPGSPGPRAFAPFVPLVFLAVWGAIGMVHRDVAEIQRMDAEREARDRRLERLLTSGPPPFECSEEEFAAILEQELAELPEWIRRDIATGNVAIGVEDDRDGSPLTLGLYHRSGDMKVITLYRLPLMRSAGRRAQLRLAVHETLLHELGHLYGMSEADLDHYTIGNHPLPGAQPVRPPLAD